MSLVDYEASSSDEEEGIVEEPKAPQENTTAEEDTAIRRPLEATTDPSPSPKLDHLPPQTLPQTQNLESPINKRAAETSQPPESPAIILPDASLLLNFPVMPSHMAYATDHSSRIAAAMAESESRKRDLNGSSSSNYTRSKVPRGNLPHSKRIPDTVEGHLLPPQLAGRSNVVTEDMSKLFLKRHPNSSSS